MANRSAENYDAELSKPRSQLSRATNFLSQAFYGDTKMHDVKFATDLTEEISPNNLECFAPYGWRNEMTPATEEVEQYLQKRLPQRKERVTRYGDEIVKLDAATLESCHDALCYIADVADGTMSDSTDILREVAYLVRHLPNTNSEAEPNPAPTMQEFEQAFLTGEKFEEIQGMTEGLSLSGLNRFALLNQQAKLAGPLALSLHQRNTRVLNYRNSLKGLDTSTNQGAADALFYLADAFEGRLDGSPEILRRVALFLRNHKEQDPMGELNAGMERVRGLIKPSVIISRY